VEGETIYLVRHGQTRWNVEGRIQGQLDSELTELGIEQARAYGRVLRQHVARGCAVRIEASPSGRAAATAALIAEALELDPIQIRPSPLLVERHMGDWAGLTMAEVEAAFPGSDPRLVIDDPGFVPPGGESYEALSARASSWLRKRRPLDVTIAVTHGLIGRTIVGAYLGHAPAVVMAGTRPQDRVFRLRDGIVDEVTV
jgi:broad specificity phosphatase PhoE